MKDTILTCIDTAVMNFVYYDRKNCEELPVGTIEKAIEAGEITVDDIVNEFKKLLIDALG